MDERINTLWPDVRFSKTERAVLAYLMANPGRWVSSDELLAEVWNYSDGVKTRTALTTVGRLRKKIEPDPTVNRVLLNLRGHGYRLKLATDEPVVTPTKPLVDPQLFARKSELESLEYAVTKGWLTTLLGPPGVGKTTLAVAWLSSRQRSGWKGQFVDVTAAQTVGQLAATLAQALRLPATTQPLHAVRSHLAAQDPLVLVVDNVEQLTEACGPLLADLAEQTETHIVLTSRRRLGVATERVVEVRPWSSDNAVAFLKHRIHTLRGRPVTPDETSALDEVAALVDGLPLGLELAASRSRMMPVTYLATRLRMDVGVLSGASSGTKGQQSLADSIAWSWSLLDADERAGLAHLSAFPGGVEMEDAEALLAGDLDLLGALIDQSLVRRIGHSSRLRVLASVRQFVLQHDVDTVPAAREKQAQWALTCVQDLGPSNDDVVAFARRERDNLLAAADWLTHQREPSLLSLLATLHTLFTATGEPHDLDQRLRAARLALPLTGQQSARVGLWLARVLGSHGDPEAALAELDSALNTGGADVDAELHQQLHAQRLHGLLDLDRPDEALKSCQNLVSTQRRDGSPRLYLTLNALGRIYQRLDDFDAADRAYSEAVQHPPEPGSEVRMASVWANLGGLRSERGDNAGALACLARGQAIAAEHRNDRVLFTIEAIIALTYARMGRLSEADQTYQRLVESDPVLGGSMSLGSTRSNAGIVAFLVGDPRRCVRLLQPLLKELSYISVDSEVYALTACYLIVAWAELDEMIEADLLAARIDSASQAWQTTHRAQWHLALARLELARAHRATAVGHHQRAGDHRQAAERLFEANKGVDSPLVQVVSDALQPG